MERDAGIRVRFDEAGEHFTVVLRDHRHLEAVGDLRVRGEDGFEEVLAIFLRRDAGEVRTGFTAGAVHDVAAQTRGDGVLFEKAFTFVLVAADEGRGEGGERVAFREVCVVFGELGFHFGRGAFASGFEEFELHFGGDFSGGEVV